MVIIMWRYIYEYPVIIPIVSILNHLIGITLWLCQQFAIENDHRNSGFSHWNGGSFQFVLCKRLPGRVYNKLIFHTLMARNTSYNY